MRGELRRAHVLACLVLLGGCAKSVAGAPGDDADLDGAVTVDDAAPPIDAAPPPIDAARPDAAVCVLADPNLGVYAAPVPLPLDGGSVDAGLPDAGPITCGGRVTPCGSLKDAITLAATHGKPYVYLAAGHYQEDGVTLAPGVTLIGGFAAATWTRTCPGDPSVTVLSPVLGTVTLRAVDLGGTAVLSTLTLESSPAAASLHDASGHGASLYGIWAQGATTALTLDRVNVLMGDAARGQDGAPGDAAAVAAGAGSCATSSASPGSAGAAGNPSSGAVVGSFDANGYHASDGALGQAGMMGGNATCGPAQAGSCASCGSRFFCSGSPPLCFFSCTQQTLSAGAGLTGCGGNPGGGGQGGRGGGSSVALFAAGAQVSISGGTLVAGGGGAGGDGGAGSGGGGPSASSNGNNVACCSSCSGALFSCGCAAGTQTGAFMGGQCSSAGVGGSGGSGGGGAGGWSYAVVKTGAATVTNSGATLAHKLPGDGGHNGSSGSAAGQSGDTLP